MHFSFPPAVFDSATKLPSGLLYGNIVQLGNFDECLGAAGPGFTGRWCRAHLTNASVLLAQPTNLALQLMLLPVQRALVQATANQEPMVRK